MTDPVYITKPVLPERKELDKYIDQIYSNTWLTNNGPLVREFKRRLELFLEVENLLLVANGTLALQIAYKTLNISGNVVTTPFSFVATTSSLRWEGIDPVFADIDQESFNIDPEKIEKEINADTTAIVPVHVFGNACNTEEIERIAKKNNIVSIFDASHAFNIRYRNKSLLNYGDASTLSFHATKVFHTIEGGAIIFKEKKDYKKACKLINFGYDSKGEISSIGINAKMNEFQAAMGLCLLDEIDDIISKRKNVWQHYYDELSGLYEIQKWESDNNNYGYFPILFKNKNVLVNIKNILEKNNIFPRRYFYPSLNMIKSLNSKQKMNISENISSRVFCLPLFPDLKQEQQKNIINLLKDEMI